MEAELVPGTSETERSHLAALGGLVAATAKASETRHWPEGVRSWCKRAPAPPAEVRGVFARALSDPDQDALAAIYEQIVAGSSRRRLGTFFTPPGLVDFMFELVKSGPGVKTVIDPGAGVGAFAVAAARRWPDAQILAVDVNNVTLGLLGLRGIHEGVTNLKLIDDNFLAWLPSDKSPGPRLIVGNPPYTRYHEFDRRLREDLTPAAAELVSRGLAGLSAFFLAVSLTSLRSQDELCLVLPGTWTEARYGEQLRRWLWRAGNRPVELHAFPADFEVFPGTQVTAMVLRVGPEHDKPQQFTVHSATFSKSKVVSTKGQRRSRTVPPPSHFGGWLWRNPPSAKPGGTRLADVASVHRGVATGANDFFFLTDDEMQRLPRGSSVPALRRLRHVDGPVLDDAQHARIGVAGLPRWLLAVDEKAVSDSRELQKLIETGHTAGLPDRHLLSRRRPWYKLEPVSAPDLFLALMSKAAIRVVENRVGAIPSNSMLGVYLVDKRQGPALAAWLRSDDGQESLLRQARHYSNGLRKLEPKDVLNAIVPNELG